MYKLIQRKKKLLLAIFGVLLMIVFVLPIGMQQMHTDPDDLLYGRIGDKKFTRRDRNQARNDIDALRDAGFAPLAQLGEAMSFGQGGGRVAAIFRESPETYALLQHEAKEAGVRPDPEVVKELFEIYFAQPTPPNPASAGRNLKPEEANAYRATIERFLLVRDNYQRVVADIKVTRPLVREGIVQRQQPTLNLVEFAAADFVAEVPAPAESAIIAQYNLYATVTPAKTPTMASTQPVQFGYHQKDKLKLQYIELPAAELMAAAMKVLKPVDLLPLDSVAFAYYSANHALFQTTPATQPTQPATLPATGSASQPAATQPAITQPTTTPALPTTRPFAEVRSEIRQKVLGNEVQTAPGAPVEDVVEAQKLRLKVEARADEIRSALRDRLAKDFKDATAAKNLAKIEKVDYLETVANEFEKSHGIRPVIKSLASEFLTASELAALPGIGQATADATPFPRLATKHGVEATPLGPDVPKTQPAAATQPATQAAGTQPSKSPTTAPATSPATQPLVLVESTKPAKAALAMYEPSPVLRDDLGNTYIFRLTAFEGEHVPTLDEARPLIVKDLKLVSAYELARRKAIIVREAAGSAASNSPIGGLPVVNPPVKEVGPITRDKMPEFPGYDLTDPAIQRALLDGGVSRLLMMAKADLSHPSTVIDLPSKQKVLVLELRTLELPWTAEEDARMQAQMISVSHSQLMREPAIQDALQGWFDPKSVAERMSFKKEE